MVKLNCFLLFFSLTAPLSMGEDVTVYQIDPTQNLHKVSDKFLSISIDPAVLLAGANLSDDSLKLVKHLSPAYIRLAGPSTQFVKYLDNEEKAFSFKEKGDNLYVTPSMWFGINEWFRLAHLRPVFAINDANSSKGVWNPISTRPLLEISEKFDVQCHWQLGYDCANKTIVQYVDNAYILKQTLNGFRLHNNSWKIVASDLSSCNFHETESTSLEGYLTNLDSTVSAITWQSPFIAKVDLGITKADLWTSVTKDKDPVTFSSAIQWAVKVGQAAILENSVIFRELRLLELTHDTPVYWFSFLHKRLMGSHVLPLKSVNPNGNLFVFGHCARRQNSFYKRGAVALLMVNNGSETSSANLRIGSYLLDRSTEVQSYLFQAANDSSMQAVLNSKTLTTNMLERPDDVLRPKLRRAKIRPLLSFEVPPMSIAFFVLIEAKYELCSINEEVTPVHEDIDQNQKESALLKLAPRIGNNRDLVSKNHLAVKQTLETIRANILKEVEVDKSYYDSIKKPQHSKLNLVNNDIDTDDRKMLHKHLKEFIDKSQDQKPVSGIPYVKRNGQKASTSRLHLTIEEIEDILKQRARTEAAARNIQFSSAELNMLVDKATLKIPKYFISKRDLHPVLLEEKDRSNQNNMSTQNDDSQMKKIKRSINMRLLNLKYLQEEHKKYMFDSRKPQTKKSKRDINLDLVKERSQSNYKRKWSVRPKFKSQKSEFEGTEISKSTPIKIDAQSSVDLFDDLMPFEDRTFEDLLTENESFPDLSDSNQDQVQKYFSSKKSNFEHVNPLYQKLPSLTKQQNNGLPVLKTSAEIKVPDGQWFCDGLQFSEEFDDGFSRKKRNTSSEAMAKNKLHNLKKNIRNDIRKLKQQLKRGKTSYFNEKLKNKSNFKPKSNIQKVTKPNVKKLIENAVSKENLIDQDLQERPLKENENWNNLGKYDSETTKLQFWKPADILSLRQEDSSLFYSWLHDPRTTNVEEETSSTKTNKKRFIDDKFVNMRENLIFDKKEQQKHDNQNNAVEWHYGNSGDTQNESMHNKRFGGNKKTNIRNTIRSQKIGNSNDKTASGGLKTRGTEIQQVQTARTNQHDHHFKSNRIIDKAISDPSDSTEKTNTPKKEWETKSRLNSNMTYLEKVLGRNKAKPIDIFFKSIKTAFEGMNNFVQNMI